ncbi:MAG TPA: DUF2254 domain-containing protein [Solirubrobacteraceae bacterium]|nr:DUF2254 domain-containing protein [Solirubrobacteraceae bacterium]
MADVGGSASLRERAISTWEGVRSSFGFLTGVAMALGLVLGFVLPSVDAALDLGDAPVFGFADPEVGRSLLETVATATVSVAGLSFSVTVVAFTLASSQLSPRVLRTFRADRLSQATLACFLGTFIYCLAVLIRLGSADEGGSVPNLSITLAVALAVVSFAMFAAFIAHIVSMLQPSSIIDGIRATGRRSLESPYPAGVGETPDTAAAERALLRTRDGDGGRPVRADRQGYVSTVYATRLLTSAAGCDAVVVQRVQIGEYVIPGLLLADVWCADHGRREDLVATVRAAFVLGRQRTPVQDPAFAVRQLADIALKGLSPGINDPTTAQNAMEALTALLVRFATGDPVSRLRADEHGVVRLVALAPDLDDLVRLGFEQVRVFAASDPAVSRRLLTLLARIDEAARSAGIRCIEPAHQAALIAEGCGASLATGADAASVRAHHAAL